MFIFTAKFNRKKAVALVLILGLILAAVIVIAGKLSGGGAADSLPAPDSNEGRIAYLESFGWQVSAQPVECRDVIIPREFPEVYSEYNALQLEQGFDLRDYAGMDAVRYTYAVLNYPDRPTGVVADIIVCQGCVIAGDVQSFALDGFMHGLAYPES